MMKYNRLPGTSLRVSEISLGTMMFGAQTSEVESHRILDYSYEHGINLWDTANVYNAGESERITGKALKGRREDIFLATKVSGQMGGGINDRGLSRRAILSAVEASLKRLNTDYIDLYYLHSPDNETEMAETMETMTNLVISGKIRYIGISNYAAWQIADILALCHRCGFIAPIITQNIYNVITRGVEKELIPFIKTHGMGMAVYNPIAGGLLTGKHKPGEPMADTRFALSNKYHTRYWSQENFSAVEKLVEIASKNGISLLTLALKWCLSRTEVTSVISGVSKLIQLEQNIAILDGGALSQETLTACDEVWLSLAGNRFEYNR